MEIDDEAYDLFLAYLERPPVFKPRLAELLSLEPAWSDDGTTSSSKATE